jgi:serine/threonine-protein kinase
MAGAPPAVASDVYSLGALLQELLIGPPPDLLRTLPLGDPPEMLPEDLEAILAKAKDADPRSRYPDVASLVADLALYRQKRPVGAREARAGYRARLFVARNALPLAIGTLVFLLLVSATLVSLALYADARRQRAASEARFEEVRSLAKFQLFTLYDRLTSVAGTLPARASLSEEAQIYLDRLASLPDAPEAVKLETARGYNRLADIQGVPSNPNIGRPKDAKRNLQFAERMLTPLADGNVTARSELAYNLLMQADMAVWQDGSAGAGERLLIRAEPLVAALDPRDRQRRELESLSRRVRLDVLGWSERYAEEAKLAADTLLWLGSWPDIEKRTPTFAIAQAKVLSAQGEGHFYGGAELQALQDYRNADRIVRDALVRWPNRPDLLSARRPALLAPTCVQTGYHWPRPGSWFPRCNPRKQRSHQPSPSRSRVSRGLVDLAGYRNPAAHVPRARAPERILRLRYWPEADRLRRKRSALPPKA